MKLSKQIFLAFCIVLILSVIDSFTNYLLSVRVRENTEFLEKSESIIRNSTRLHKAIIVMQSAFRGYLLTNDSSFLRIYDNGKRNIPVLFAVQKNNIHRDVHQRKLLDTIVRLHEQWVLYADSLVEARKQISFSESSRLLYERLFENKLKKQIGKSLNDEISRQFNLFDRAEYYLRNRRKDKLLASIHQTHTFSFVFLSLTIVIGVCSMIYIVRLISKRIASMVQLAENISKGNFTVVMDTKHDELTALSKSLNIMSEKLSKNFYELERQNKELNRFAYVVSHDLKAPLRGIHNVIQWIEEDMGREISPEMRKYLDIIPQRTKRMEDLINGLLEYARTREKTAPEAVDTNQMVTDICHAIVPRNIQLELLNLPVVFTERIKFQQLMTNLIDNAVKYSDAQSAQIIVSCIELSDSYEFSVKDNGMGIAREYHEKIFEIFQTLREKNDAESTGIGLAITKKIIDDLHGSISINSKPGEGAEFIFTWPKVSQPNSKYEKI